MVIKVAPWAAFTRMWQDRQRLPAATSELRRSPDRLTWGSKNSREERLPSLNLEDS
jgi:hypothetical protein